MSKKDMEKEIQRHEAQNDLSYKSQQQALIANFVEEFDANVKLWKSAGSTFNLIRSQLGLPKNNTRKKPELKYPENHFTIVQRPPRVHSRKHRGPVDMDEVPSKAVLFLEFPMLICLLRLSTTETLAEAQ